MLPMINIIIACPHPTKFVHDESGPSLGSLSLNALLKLVFDRFTRVRKAKNTLLGDGC